jgi:hypothetical protein
MPSAKLAVALGLAALSLSACGIAAKPEVGTLKADVKSHQGLDDPRTKQMTCLRQDHIAVRETEATVAGLPLRAMQVGTTATGPSVAFEPTPGGAQLVQIHGQAQGAEVIGSALLYPHQATDGLLERVEGCVAQGVSG